MLIKKVILPIILLFGGCSVKDVNATNLQPALIDARDNSCQDELKKTISKLINAHSLEISSDAFSKESYLYLTNHKRDDFLLQPSKLQNDLGGRKTLFLYIESDDLYIGLVDFKKNIIKKEKLQSCQATTTHKK